MPVERSRPLEAPLPPPLPLPPGVREAIGARVALLPDRAADTLTIASVIGDTPPIPLLQAVSGRDLESLLADLAGAANSGNQIIVSELTLRAGRVTWDLNGRASENWKTFKYDRKKWTK